MPLTSNASNHDLIHKIEHAPLFNGNILYVATDGDDSNNGSDPHEALKTIGTAIAASSAGDAISVKSGTYTETGLDLNFQAGEIWLEIGVIISPASGTALTVSADHCKIKCNDKCSMLIFPGANETGVLVSGNFCCIHGVRVVCASSADIGFDITGNGNVLENCASADPLIAAFKNQGDKTILRNLLTGGELADTSIGYWFTNSCDKFRLLNSSSQGHATASIQVDTGCTNGVIDNFSSGGGDGRWIDTDETTVFAKFTFDNNIEKEIDITQAGAGTWEYNMFKITGVVIIYSIEGIIEETLVGSNTNCFLDVYSTNGQDDLSKNATLSIGAAIEGSFIARLDGADKILSFHNADNAFLVDEIDATKQGFRVGEDRTGGSHVDSHVRFIHTTAGASSGKIHWYVKWDPISEDGWFESV